MVVEKVTGAWGMLAVQKVLTGPTDGSLVYMGGTDTVAVPMVNARVKLNWEADLLPVGRMTTFPMILAVPAASVSDPNGPPAGLPDSAVVPGPRCDYGSP